MKLIALTIALATAVSAVAQQNPFEKIDPLFRKENIASLKLSESQALALATKVDTAITKFQETIEALKKKRATISDEAVGNSLLNKGAGAAIEQLQVAIEKTVAATLDKKQQQIYSALVVADSLIEHGGVELLRYPRVHRVLAMRPDQITKVTATYTSRPMLIAAKPIDPEATPAQIAAHASLNQQIMRRCDEEALRALDEGQLTIVAAAFEIVKLWKENRK